jgi:hypothetical protein
VYLPNCSYKYKEYKEWKNKMKKNIYTIIICMALASCSSTSEIVPAGKDTYMIGGENSRISDPATVKIKLYKAANNYCKKQKKSFMPVSSNQETMFYGAGSSELTFRCLYENDPEFTRPYVKKTPGTSIEVMYK